MKGVGLPRSLKVSTAAVICLNLFVFSLLGLSLTV